MMVKNMFINLDVYIIDTKEIVKIQDDPPSEVNKMYIPSAYLSIESYSYNKHREKILYSLYLKVKIC